MKKILGLDLGTTSIGFAYIIEDENRINSEIKKIGVRVNPLTTDEQTNFEKGKPTSINADRTLKRGARRNLNRYQDRREDLKEILLEFGIISNETVLTEIGKDSTFLTYKLRAKAVSERVEKEEFARILLAINKKRGYKSSRKAKNEDEGQAIDGMVIAKRLYDENLTPGQLAYQLLQEGKKTIPDFYRSDLQTEFDNVWEFQKQFYPEILTTKLFNDLQGKNKGTTWKICEKPFGIVGVRLEGKATEKRLQQYQIRSKSVSEKINLEYLAISLQEINNDLNKTSKLLGKISDRSKELYFNKETVGQYLYKQLENNPHTRLKNQVFYRQDYLDEFETIWETQSQFHSELTPQLKEEIRDVIIFYQRKLKSQKSLVSFCEFESKAIEIKKNGQKVKRTIGAKVAPKSSPLFQEFKIWQMLNNINFKNKNDKTILELDQEAKETLFEELNLKGNLSTGKAIELLGYKSKDFEANYKEIEGNKTNVALYNAFLKILEIEGYNEDLLKLSDKDDINVSELKTPASEIKKMVKDIFDILEIDTEILNFNADLEGKDFEQQKSYQLWHLLYSAEDDTKKFNEEDILVYGNDLIGLKKKLCEKFGFKPEHAKILANVALTDDYGSLSTKAMRKIYPFIKENKYSEACRLAGYNHSASSLTKEEIATRPLKDKLELLKKNSLRNPVVEKILNQMVNVVNTLIDTENDKLEAEGKIRNFRFDEIRIELARELKKNAKERAEMTANINSSKIKYEKFADILIKEFGIKYPTKNDIVRYRLYEELKNNGYHDLYTNKYIPREKLFSKEIDIEHIIPKAKVFDDSFSNKTLSFRKDNLAKADTTAYDYIEGKQNAKELEEYLSRITSLYEAWKKNNEEGISKAKYQKLLKKESEIGDGFIERDLRDSQYIAKKAKNMLFEITRSVVSTSGSITDRLREDWGLINVMKELNMPKYKALGLTEIQERKDGNSIEIISDWTKRNDHRHHAMDALTIAFTKHSYIQYLNYLNARKNETHKLHGNIIAIETKELEIVEDSNGSKKRKFIPPMDNFRQIAKEQLEGVLISHKAKNKVVTKNKNKIKTKNGEKVKIELTPRGQLHKETVYGRLKQEVVKQEKIGTKFDKAKIETVTSLIYRTLLLRRLEENNNDPKKAFGGRNVLSKNPIYLDEAKTIVLPETVKTKIYEDNFTIRKDITPDLKIDKVIDEGIKRILQKRLNEFGGKPKEAFVDLEKNPIWLNKEKGITIKSVTISGVSNAEALHYKKDHFGNEILDENGNKQPVDFVSTGNNHHVAIYRDEKGDLQDNIVTFYEAVERVNQGLPVIDKEYNNNLGWKFLFSMKQNEMFVFPNEEIGFNPSEIDLLDPKNKSEISPNLYRVQKISKLIYGNSAVREYLFRHHLETTVDDKKELKDKAYLNIKSLGYFQNIIKVRINHLGDIVKVGE